MDRRDFPMRLQRDHRHEELFHKCIGSVEPDTWSDVTKTLPHLEGSVRTAIQGCLEKRTDALGVIALRAQANTDQEVRAICRTLLAVLEQEFPSQKIGGKNSESTTDMHRLQPETESHDDDDNDTTEELLHESYARLFPETAGDGTDWRLVA